MNNKLKVELDAYYNIDEQIFSSVLRAILTKEGLTAEPDKEDRHIFWITYSTDDLAKLKLKYDIR